ncbi:hypothetical protein MA16_Dca024406 [Dendrobium catenatum]|uniref:Uncharacterized protein n=1 Tax=Dendrobium catenatum TaxID=906689 RepID=A0A2I0VTD1_9ASPA|nr:hypothetical protein MA16_Dca024406 [Dendrobium catenatum]
MVLTENYNALIHKKLSKKLKDPGSFIIPMTIGDKFCGRDFCDLGFNINLIPLFIFKRLDDGEVQSTIVIFQLVDKSFTCPMGVVEYILVKVDKFIFPIDFFLGLEDDSEILIILGRPFLAIENAILILTKGN